MNNYFNISKKITSILFLARSLGSAAIIASFTVSAIVGAQLSGKPALAGVPSAGMQIGSAIGALALGFLMDRVGRRKGLFIGMIVGILGAGLASLSIGIDHFMFYLLGTFLMGIAVAAQQLGRFAAAEAAPPEIRGRAISTVVLGGTVGSIGGPLLVGPSSIWADQFGLKELSGPYIAAAILFIIVAGIIYVGLRPDPLDVGKEIAEHYPEITPHEGKTRTPIQIFRSPGVIVAVSTMVFGQIIMVMLMGITSLHMKNHQLSLGDISIVISAHTFGMYAFSLLTGRLIDRWGKGPVIMTGAGILFLANVLAPLSIEIFPLASALFLLGLGWNFCFIGGSALLTDQLSSSEKARTQGANDLLIGFAAALANLSGGLLFAATSYRFIGIIGFVFSLIPLGLVGWWVKQVSKSEPRFVI